MRIIDKNNSVQEICDLIVQKARYQKVVLCVDENSDTQLIDDIVNGLGKEVVLLTYYYNKRNISQFFDMINNGVRVVIYNVALEHFYKLQNDNNYILNRLICQFKGMVNEFFAALALVNLDKYRPKNFGVLLKLSKKVNIC